MVLLEYIFHFPKYAKLAHIMLLCISDHDTVHTCRLIKVSSQLKLFMPLAFAFLQYIYIYIYMAQKNSSLSLLKFPSASNFSFYRQINQYCKCQMFMKCSTSRSKHNTYIFISIQIMSGIIIIIKK